MDSNTRIYIYQFSVDNGGYLENLTSAMTDRDGWKEQVKGVCAISVTYWLSTQPSIEKQVHPVEDIKI